MGLLLVVRHGQASYGHDNYDQLSELGYQQARLVGQRLARSAGAIDHVVTGRLIRQVQTGATLCEHLEPASFTTTSRLDLDEFDHEGVLGANVGVARFDPSSPAARRDADQALEAAIAAWSAGTGETAGESFAAFAARVASALDELTALPGTTVAVSSAGVISMMIAQLLGVDARVWAALNRVMVNTGVTKIVTGRSGRSLININDHAHLEHDRRLITYR